MFMPDLYWITLLANFAGVVLSLWLGLYLVSRNAKYPIAWMTALVLWFMAGLFMNILLALNPPPPVPYYPTWLRFFFPFWPAGAFEGASNSWLQGWSITPAFAIWHHVTTMLRPGRMNAWRWTRVLFGYALAILAIYLQTNTAILFTVENSDPLYLNSLHSTSLFPIFGAAMIFIIWASVVNLVRSARSSPSNNVHKQLIVLAWATVIAGIAGPLASLGSFLDWPIPMLVISMFALLMVCLIGFGVARYSALMEGRTIQRDFSHSLALLAIVVGFYLLASWILVQVYAVPRVALIFIPILAVLTHFLVNPVIRLMDWLFYRKEIRDLRWNMREVARLAVEGEALGDHLRRLLHILCKYVRASYGLVLVYNAEGISLEADYQWEPAEINLTSETLAADDVTHLEPGHFGPPFDDAALLIPLYLEQEQIGALILGCPVNGIRYASEDVEYLLNRADRISDAIVADRFKTHAINKIVELADSQRITVSDPGYPIPADTVELALRSIFDYSVLADSPLGEMRLVHNQLPAAQVTHIERGKAVHEVLIRAIEKMRPSSTPPRNPPPREWYPYLILYDAYLEEIPNRDIMLRLYISEGTFNRTRRAAIRSLARALGEMEAGA
jgi:hypothetical protein